MTPVRCTWLRRPFVTEKDRVMRTPFSQASTHMLDLHGESAVAKALLELAIVPRGPDSEDAARREGRARRGDPFVAVETCVARRRERGRTVVDVEDHRVEPPGVCAQRHRDVSNFDADARILQRIAGKLAQAPTVPVH